jgi:hypothetical protein
MNKLDLALRLARESHQSHSKAADAVDTLVHKLLRDLSRTHPSPAQPKRGKAKEAS